LAPAFAQSVQLSLDASEADTALAILQKEAAHVKVEPADWEALFSTGPYRRLKVREASVNNAFTDDAFKAFLSAP
jgi:transcriptional regulator of nitric oxide reductase